MSKRTTLLHVVGGDAVALGGHALAQLVDEVDEHVEGEEEQGQRGQVGEGHVGDVRDDVAAGLLDALVGDEPGEVVGGPLVAAGAGVLAGGGEDRRGRVGPWRRWRACRRPPCPRRGRRRRPGPPGCRRAPAGRGSSPARCCLTSWFMPADLGELLVAVAGLAGLLHGAAIGRHVDAGGARGVQQAGQDQRGGC